MATLYGSDGDVEPERLFQEVNAVHQRLRAALNLIPPAGEDDEQPWRFVLLEVEEFLRILVENLDTWMGTARNWPRVPMRRWLHDELLAVCQAPAGEADRDPEYLVAVLTSVGAAMALSTIERMGPRWDSLATMRQFYKAIEDVGNVSALAAAIEADQAVGAGVGG